MHNKIYTIKTHKRVDVFFDKHRDIARKAILVFSELSKDPFRRDLSCDIVRFQGNTRNHFRLRIGWYRILYEVNEDEIYLYLYDADSRGSIYK